MKKEKINPVLIRVFTLLAVVCFSTYITNGFGQSGKTLVVDVSHGGFPFNVENYNRLLPENSGTTFINNTEEITASVLNDTYGLILFMPAEALKEQEKSAIIDYLGSGGSLLLVVDEERRMPLNGLNDIITPFDIRLTGDAPVRHNCGAVAEKSEVCADRREIPYSRGRSIEGGTVISRIYDEGDYVHCAYKKLTPGGKIIVMSDGMAALFMGGPDGVRFSGTRPMDSKFWGKDSQIFMTEILAFLLKE